MMNIALLAEAQTKAFGTWDIILFCIAVVAVIGLGIWKSRDTTGTSKEEKDDKGDKSAADYFLAGRGLTWWLVGFSLIAANISTEQFVGMSGQAADWLGMAIASYEWMAAITLVVVAFLFLPKLLKGGVYTIPEFLECRYNTKGRTAMALATLLVLVGVPTATVIYSGSKVITVFFAGYSAFGLDFGDLNTGCWIIALCGAVYVFVGGLKACAWTDLIWGAALILGGGVVAWLAIRYLGGADAQSLWDTRVATSSATVDHIQNAGAWDRFMMLNSGDAAEGANGVGGKLHMVRPGNDSVLPWTALVLGLWIPNFFYWGLNQYIMQRTLASKSLAEGQKGIVFAAFLKLLIPFVVVIPGILAYNLFSSDLRKEAVSKNADSGAMIIHDAQAYKQSELTKLKDPAERAKKSQEIDEKITEVATKVFPMTEEFVAVETDLAYDVIKHNVNFAYANDAIKKADVMGKMEVSFAKVREDAANTLTNRTQRLVLAKDITDLNGALIEDMKLANDKGLTVDGVLGKLMGSYSFLGTKLVGYDYDAAFPTLLSKLLYPGISWFVLAALFGAVVSSLASMLNSASTILTMDVYNKIRKNAKSTELVRVGKFGVLLCMLLAMCIAPALGNPKFGGIFNFVQEFQGFISPGALCVFLFGFFVHRCPRFFGWFGICANVIMYGAMKICVPAMPFLNRMAWCFGVLVALGAIFTLINIMRGGKPIILESNNKVSIETSPRAKFCGFLVVAMTIALYIFFW
ncbi:MAG: sodium/solute symporter [Akkermansia sp.]